MDSHRDEGSDGSNMFMTETAFEKYSQLSRITDLFVAKDELLKKEQNGNKAVSAKRQMSAPKKSAKKRADDTQDGASNMPRKQAGVNKQHRKVSISIPFPRLSWFTKKQHAEYLRLRAKFLKGPPPQPSVDDIKDFNMFKEMHMKVLQEQDEFVRYLEMVARQSVNDYNYIHPEANRFINTYLNKERLRVLMYPHFYKLLDDVPLATQRSKDIFTLRHEAILLELGHLSRIIQPKIDFHQKCFVPLNFDKINARFPVSDPEPRKLPPCSQDPNCLALADKYNADIVMSASTLACLLDNQLPSYSRQWELPFKIVLLADTNEAMPKSRVFLDKPFAPKVLMPRERNELYHRFAIKTLFQHPLHNTSCTMEELRTPQHNSFNGYQEETGLSTTKETEVFGTNMSQPQTDSQDLNQPDTSTQGSVTTDNSIGTVEVMASDTVTSSEALSENSDVKGATQVCGSVVLTMKSDNDSSHDTKDKTNELTTVMKTEPDSNGNIKNADGSAITEDGQNIAQEIKPECSQKVKNMFSFSDDADDTEDEKLVIDAPATPAKIKQNAPQVGDLGCGQKDNMITNPTDDSMSPTENNKTPFNMGSPIPTSPCVATPLSPPHTSTCTTPSHVPIIPLEKVVVAVNPSSQWSNKQTETFLHVKSSQDTLPSPFNASKTNTDTTNNKELDSSRFQRLSANPGDEGNNAQGSDTDGELVIDMATQGQMKGYQSLSSVKEERKDNITDVEPIAGNRLIDSIFTSDQMEKDEVKREQRNEELVASVSIPSSFKQVDIRPGEELPGISSRSDHLREDEGKSKQTNDAQSDWNKQMNGTNTERVYNLRKRQIEVSPSRLATESKVEEPKLKRRLRSHTAALPVERMLRSTTRAMSRRQKSSGSLSQLDGTEDKQNEEACMPQQKPKAKIKHDQNVVTCPLDNILEAQNKLLDGSFTANLPSQSSQKTCDTGQTNPTPSHFAVKSGLDTGPLGQTSLVSDQTNMNAEENSELSRQASTIVEDDNSSLFQVLYKLVNNLKAFNKLLRLSFNSKEGDALEDASDYKKPPSSNVSYSLYTLGSIRIIIRYKYHGILRCKKKTRMHLAHLQPKLEYQPQYGLEQLTASEMCKTWLALQLRPQTSVIRVRINAYNGDIMDQEVLSKKDVLPCHSPFHPGHAMSHLHKILMKLKRLPPGDFLLSHNPGQLYCHIKTSTSSTSGVYDLHKAYLEQSANSTCQYSDTNVPWIPIDPGLMLPFHKKYQCIPATFEPKDSVPKHTFKPKENKRNKKKKKKASGGSS